MNWEQDLAGEKPELEQALRHFKASVDAWSDAAYHRPRTAAKLAVRHSWRMAAGWALGCLLAVGSLAGAAHEVYHRQELAKIAAQKAAQKAAQERAAQERAAAARAAALQASTQVVKRAPAVAGTTEDASSQDEDLLATVDSDVSRGVPAAMEPLAQLMDDNGTQ
jgi:hypothetical protein